MTPESAYIAARTGIRVVVTGGRDYADRETVWRVLDAVARKHGIAALAHGGANGADSLAAAWALNRGVPCEPYPADWRIRGKAAGPERNRRMLDHFRPDVVIAFPGGRGTRDCCTAAGERGVRVWEPVASIGHTLEIR